jgi:hypothetical protein
MSASGKPRILSQWIRGHGYINERSEINLLLSLIEILHSNANTLSTQYFSYKLHVAFEARFQHFIISEVLSIAEIIHAVSRRQSFSS